MPFYTTTTSTTTRRLYTCINTLIHLYLRASCEVIIPPGYTQLNAAHDLPTLTHSQAGTARKVETFSPLSDDFGELVKLGIDKLALLWYHIGRG